MAIGLDSLNENQLKAVLWEDGPLLVLAGPGSGKTLVLTKRVARLIGEREDASVLALTFGTKAAAEMRERVDKLLGEHGGRANLCTFHAFAADILRQHGGHLGLRPDFVLLTRDEDRIAVLDSVAAKYAASNYVLPTDRKNLLELIDQLFAESYEGGLKVAFLVHTPEWLPGLFVSYCDALIASNRLDFSSLIHFARKLLLEQPAVARVVRVGWTHVCVDEFQDTNRAQYDLLGLLVGEKRPNLFIVADDDQIIYQWNGASPERLLALQSDYEMEVMQLPENYRCPLEIIEVANRLIVHNRLRTKGKKPLIAFRSTSLNDNIIRLNIYDSPDDEIAAVASDIKKRGLNPGDCVILARATKLLEQAAKALQATGFDAYVARKKNDFNATIIRVVFNVLRLANSRHDRDVLRRLCVAWSDIDAKALELDDVIANASLVGGDFLRAWVDAVSLNKMENAVALIKRIRSSLVDRIDFPQVVDWFLGEGIKPWRDEKDIELIEELDTWKVLHGEIIREEGEDNITLNKYIQQMDLAPKAARPNSSSIRCMTVHGSKGLEFQHVYLIGMAQEVFPSFQALRKGPNSKELEEERRNCFVAITRVQETLTLTLARKYNGYSKEPSQFLAEMEIKK